MGRQVQGSLPRRQGPYSQRLRVRDGHSTLAATQRTSTLQASVMQPSFLSSSSCLYKCTHRGTEWPIHRVREREREMEREARREGENIKMG